MRPKLALKNIWRSWVRSLFIFILLAATTYSLFSNVMEYVINRRETDAAIELYDGIITMHVDSLHPMALGQSVGNYLLADSRGDFAYYPEEMIDSYRNDVRYERFDNSELEEISQYPYISYADDRYMTSGVMDEYFRIDDNEYYYRDFTDWYVIEATVEQYYPYSYELLVSDFEFLAGKKIDSFNFEQVLIKFEVEQPVRIMQDGTEYRPEIWGEDLSVITEKSRYGAEFAQNLVPGERYVFVTRFEGVDRSPMAKLPVFYIADQYTYDWCNAVWSVEGEPEGYIETEKFAALKTLLEIVETDLHTFDVVYTKNMGSIRYFENGKIGIVEGRRLNYDDYLNKSNVCVISHDMARVFDLDVGDSITVDLGNKLFEQYEGIGSIALIPERLSTDYTEATLEIVGIFKDTRRATLRASDPCWSYSINTIFVPTHLLNVDEAELEGHVFAPGEYSLVIENVYDVELFKEEYLGKFFRMRMKPVVEDGNWKEIEASFEESSRVAVIKIIVLSCAVFATTLFTVLLYILGRKRDYAVMRVLGTTKKSAKNTLVLPLMVITLAAVLVGTAAAWVYTANNITEKISNFQTYGYTVNADVPLWLVLACIASVMLLAYGFASVIIGAIGRKSPLALLQDSAQKKEKKKKKAELPKEPERVELGQWVSLAKPAHDGKKRRCRFISRFVTRSIRRSKAKSLMFVIVTALLLNVSGQLNIMLDTYTEIFEETEVVSSYAGSLNLNYMDQLRSSGYVKDVFYRATRSVEINGNLLAVCFTNDIDRYAESEVYVEFLDGYDKSDMNTNDNIIIMNKDFMLLNGIELGDKVYIAGVGKFSNQMNYRIGKRLNMHWNDKTYEELKEMLYDDVMEWYKGQAGEFTVIGSTGYPGASAFLPGVLEMNTVYGKLVIMDKIEATLIDNWQAKEYRKYGEELAKHNLTYEVAFIMDTGKIENIGNMIQLLEIIAPVAIIAMLVIGVFMTSLIIVQTSKDVAIMRVLGTSKARTRVIIVAERMILCIIGMVLAAAVMFAMRGVNAVVLQKTAMVLALYFAAVLLSSCVASVAVSRKNVLELLQTKE